MEVDKSGSHRPTGQRELALPPVPPRTAKAATLEPHGLDGQHERLWELRLGNGGLCARVQGKRAFSGIID